MASSVTRILSVSVGLLGLTSQLVRADEFTAAILRVDGDSITLQRHTLKKKTRPQPEPMQVASNCRVFLASYNKLTKTLDAGDEIAGGIKNDIFKKLPEQGVGARVYTNDHAQVVELRLFQVKPTKKSMR